MRYTDHGAAHGATALVARGDCLRPGVPSTRTAVAVNGRDREQDRIRLPLMRPDVGARASVRPGPRASCSSGDRLGMTPSRNCRGGTVALAEARPRLLLGGPTSLSCPGFCTAAPPATPAHHVQDGLLPLNQTVRHLLEPRLSYQNVECRTARTRLCDRRTLAGW